jgi:regulator of sigma E protease
MDLSTLDVIWKVVVVFGLIVFVHELGHFSVAKLVGVGVERFSLGFGPKLIGRTVGETEYLISAVPLGGYVKMIGEETGEEIAAEDIPRSFPHQSLTSRFLIVAAGPCANFVTAFVLFSLAFASFGIPVAVEEARVGAIVPDSPAQRAGLQAGDEIVSISGSRVQTWEEMAEHIRSSQGEELSLQVKRAGSQQPVELVVSPELRQGAAQEGRGRYAIGIMPDSRLEQVSAGRAVLLGAEQTWALSVLIVQTVGKLIQGEVSTKELGGPILIAQVAGQQAQRGLSYLVHFTALINVNLAVFNLLPIPILDGGHLLFLFIELLLGRPPSLRSREVAFRVGFLVIISLVVLVFYNDIARLVR